MNQPEGMPIPKDAPALISPKRPGREIRTSLVWRKSLKQRLGLESCGYLPEPLDDRMIGAVAILVNRMLSPVIHVDITKATHQQLVRKWVRCKRGGLRKLRTLSSLLAFVTGQAGKPAVQESMQMLSMQFNNADARAELPLMLTAELAEECGGWGGFLTDPHARP